MTQKPQQKEKTLQSAEKEKFKDLFLRLNWLESKEKKTQVITKEMLVFGLNAFQYWTTSF
jgi:hypothetical protein